VHTRSERLVLVSPSPCPQLHTDAPTHSAYILRARIVRCHAPAPVLPGRGAAGAAISPTRSLVRGNPYGQHSCSTRIPRVPASGCSGSGSPSSKPANVRCFKLCREWQTSWSPPACINLTLGGHGVVLGSPILRATARRAAPEVLRRWICLCADPLLSVWTSSTS
jgi:hypothetical protein